MNVIFTKKWKQNRQGDAQLIEMKEYAEQRLVRLQAMIDNPDCSVTNDPKWDGYKQIERHNLLTGRTAND